MDASVRGSVARVMIGLPDVVAGSCTSSSPRRDGARSGAARRPRTGAPVQHRRRRGSRAGPAVVARREAARRMKARDVVAVEGRWRSRRSVDVPTTSTAPPAGGQGRDDDAASSLGFARRQADHHAVGGSAVRLRDRPDGMGGRDDGTAAQARVVTAAIDVTLRRRGGGLAARLGIAWAGAGGPGPAAAVVASFQVSERTRRREGGRRRTAGDGTRSPDEPATGRRGTDWSARSRTSRRVERGR